MFPEKLGIRSCDFREVGQSTPLKRAVVFNPPEVACDVPSKTCRGRQCCNGGEHHRYSEFLTLRGAAPPGTDLEKKKRLSR